MSARTHWFYLDLDSNPGPRTLSGSREGGQEFLDGGLPYSRGNGPRQGRACPGSHTELSGRPRQLSQY